MKFSIRFSISTLFAALLLLISLTIIGTTYFTMNKMMVNASKDSLQKSSKLILSEISDYLSVFRERTEVSAALLNRHYIGLNNPLKLRRYMIDLVSNRPNISGVYYSDPKGNLFFIEKDFVHNELHLKEVNRIAKPAYLLEAVLDKDGHILSSTKTDKFDYDPRIRPFYMNTVEKKGFNWTNIYKFKLTPRGETIIGITANKPVYDQAGHLEAIFSIDTTIDIFKRFISELRKTPHTFIYIMDSEKHLVSTHTTQCANTICHLNDIQDPYVHRSLELFNQTKQPLFSFNVKGEKYLANYISLSNLLGEGSVIGIILPFNDIAGPIHTNILISLSIIFALLLIGLILADLLGKRISKPIIYLADDARSIAKMEIGHKTQIKSYINEVRDMRDAFNLMKSGLKSFARYVPFALVKQLIATGEVAKVGGKNRNMTILFSDIQGFTSLSENMKPSELMEYLSQYFDVMTKVVQSHHGTIDKYIGDAVMAFWGAPNEDKNHAKHACQTALKMLKELDKLNEHWVSKGKPTLQIRIGINSANVVVGNVGSDDRLSYTVMGDGVNLASRLEGLNKEYHSDILVSENTHALVKNDSFEFRYIDDVIVRGKKTSVKVYELLKESIIEK